MMLIIGILLVAFLAFSNGANDNFKGVATLFGSGTTDYKKALTWASMTTLLGSFVALLFAQKLLTTFSGKGLVPNEILQTNVFPIAVTFAAASTVWLATKLGFPISTTHALTGALVGTGWVASNVNVSQLGKSFFLPLAVSPIIAFVGAIIVYPILRYFSKILKVEKSTCVCVGNQVELSLPANVSSEMALSKFQVLNPQVTISSEVNCKQIYQSDYFGMKIDSLVNGLHYLSAGTVCFARALNDTPKIAAMILIFKVISPNTALLIVAILMTIGGLVSSKKVAETMSLKVTEMSPGQGLSGNLMTSFIVLFASKWGVPVSTTHVSCGALFGIGTVNGHAHWKTIFSILLAWLITLPVSAILGATGWLLFSNIF